MANDKGFTLWFTGLSGAGKTTISKAVLDDTLGAERIVMVVCDWPRPVADLIGEARAALARAGGDPAQMGAATTCIETATLIRKVAR